MHESFQRLLMMSEPEILPLNAQAARGQVREPERSQFAHLLRHFLERFFNHETASPDGDAKARLVQIAVAAGLPGFAVALYLWPVYHPFPGWPPGHGSDGKPPSYWLQVDHHFFFVVYSFVVMGIVAVLEWDLFFPDLLDIFVLKPLPVPDRTTFAARVAAIAILLGGVLFDANFFAALVLPSAIDPPDLPRFLTGHLLAVAGSGLFAALFVLAFECVVLTVLGERWFRRISLFMQGLTIAALLMLLLLFPELSSVAPVLLQSGKWYARAFPPFWFLGIYQRVMEGGSALPIYRELARTGCMMILLAAAIVIITYPLGYLRKTRQLIEGAALHPQRNWLTSIGSHFANAAFVRSPERRAIFHYVTQTLFRVPRYRIYLVLYGGVGLSIIVASVLRFSVAHGRVDTSISADGLRASIGIVAFWALTGLRLAFLSPGNERGSWIFHFIDGRPPEFRTALERSRAVKTWALVFVAVLTGAACLAAGALAPPEALTLRAVAAQLLVAAGMCLLLTDLLFLHVTTVALAGEPSSEQPNLALAVAKYFTFFPVVVWLSVVSGPWMEESAWHLVTTAAAVAVAHALIELRHRALVRESCLLLESRDREDLFFVHLDLGEVR
jgi:hypothetical protein